MIRTFTPLAFTMTLAAFPTPQEALSAAFPGAQLTRREHYLTEAQGQRVLELAGTGLSGLWTVVYEARRDDRLIGIGVFDTHRVRTLNETLLVAISDEGRILRVEVVAFKEPLDYLPREAWVKQFQDHRLDPELNLKKGIRPLSGATLSAQAMTDASRRALALQGILYGASK